MFIELTVRGFHLDVFGHVNNARYLEFLEDARWEIFGELLKDIQDNDYSMAIVNININYHIAARLNQRLRVDGIISRIGNKSFVMRQKAVDITTQKVVVDADITCVMVNNETDKAIPITDYWRERLNCYTCIEETQ